MNNVFWLCVFAAIAYYLYNRRSRAQATDISGNGSSTSSVSSSSVSGSEAELTNIINKVGRTFLSRKYDEGLALINDNIEKYSGTDRAQLLNQRGGLYSIKGDNQSALADYKEAYQLDNNITNLNNYVETLVKLGMMDEARPLAEQGLKNPNAGKSEKKLFESVLNG